jgi:hypothetical protein
MKKCSEILQDLAKDMDNVSKRITVVQEQSLVTKTATSPEEAMVTKTATSPEEAMSQDK